MWYIYTMEYYLAIKKNAFESVLMRWINLEPIIQSEVSQEEKVKYHILMHIYRIQKDGTKELICRAAMNNRIHVSFSVLVSSGYMPRSGIASCGCFMASFLRNLFHSGCINLFPPTVQEGGEGLRPISKEYLFHFGHFEIEILGGTQIEMSRRQ